MMIRALGCSLALLLVACSSAGDAVRLPTPDLADAPLPVAPEPAPDAGAPLPSSAELDPIPSPPDGGAAAPAPPAPAPIGFRAVARLDLVGAVLARWERATCLNLPITADGAHEIRFTETGLGRGRIGQTSGTWENATISVKEKGFSNAQISIVLTHELAHLLAITNDHQPRSVMSADDGFEAHNQLITAPLLARVCEKRECGCFAPEG